MLFQLSSTIFLRGKYFKNYHFSGLGKFLQAALLVFESDRATGNITGAHTNVSNTCGQNC
jgi:hypothetical protein